jgi:hypothetical protein
MCTSSLEMLKVKIGGNGEMGKWGNGGMGEWGMGNGENEVWESK